MGLEHHEGIGGLSHFQTPKICTWGYRVAAGDNVKDSVVTVAATDALGNTAFKEATTKVTFDTEIIISSVIVDPRKLEAAHLSRSWSRRKSKRP
jgi:hypothetical protein